MIDIILSEAKTLYNIDENDAKGSSMIFGTVKDYIGKEC